MTVVLVHEWLTNVAGSEKVVAAMRRAYPGAPLFTSMWWPPAFPDWAPRTSFLQRFATGPDAHVRMLPALPAAFRALRLPEAELVITSFHTFALHARVRQHTPHLVYCHTPPRFLWAAEQLAGEALPGPPWLGAVAGVTLRPVDRRRAQRPTLFVANARTVARRIERAYGRPAVVVHPPVEIERFAAATSTVRGEHLLVLSRLVPYKRVDLAVAACTELGVPLVVAGDGRAADRLRAIAGPTVSFVGRVDDDELPALVASARALLFPGEEDFGITPVEAMAAGTPVVAYGRGGATETVVDGLSGVLVEEQSVAAFTRGIQRALGTTWDHEAVSASVRRFDEERFRRELRDAAASIV